MNFINFFLTLKLKVLFCMLMSCLLSFLFFKEGFIGWRTSRQKENYPMIIWWTTFTEENNIVKQCRSNNNCIFTNNRSFLRSSNVQALLFYGSSISPDDFPPSLKDHARPLWGLLHEESPKNVAMLQHRDALSLFNISATFSRHSNVPLTLQHLSDLDALTSSSFIVSLSKKNKLLKTLAPVVYVQSDCDTPSERDAYVAELMKYIAVDSYGTCLRNKQLPNNIQNNMQGMHDKDFWHLLAQYKFVIAFENAVCEDYITEKLWRPLIIGSIPIYYGSPSIQDWLPNKKSAILITDFNSPKELSEYILKVNFNDSLYNSYITHKHNQITNKKLIESLDFRTWSAEPQNFESMNFVDAFECYVCDRVHELMEKNSNIKWQVSVDHYKCPPPVSPITHAPNRNNEWLHQWYQGKAEAQILQKWIRSGQQFTLQQFYDEVGKLMIQTKKYQL